MASMVSNFSELESTRLTENSTSLSTTATASTLESTRRLNMTREEVKRRELLHTTELLKLELSQKNLLIDTLKQEHETNFLEMEEKLNDAQHEKVMYSTQLALLRRGFEEEMRQLQQRAKAEAEKLKHQIKKYEEQQLTSSEQVENIKLTLQAPLISELKYVSLRDKEIEYLNVEEHILMRYYELCQDNIQRAARLEGEAKQLRDDNHSKYEEIQRLRKDLHSAEGRCEELELESQQLRLQVQRIGRHVEEGNTKIDMFDQIRIERDSLLREKSLLTARVDELGQNLKHFQGEHSAIRSGLSSAEQKVSLLTHDKDYLSKQLAEVSKRCEVAEEKVLFLGSTLETTTQARGELYEKLLSSREIHRSEFKDKFREEIESLRAKTNSELEQMKRQTREMYERENRVLSEAKDGAQIERDRALQGEKDALQKYENLLNNFRQLQVQGDSHVSELQSDNKLKMFEFERLQLLHDETKRNLQAAELENKKLAKKVEVLTEEVYRMRSDHMRSVHELESRLREQSSRLETFEKLEKELDDVVLQAAEIENESAAEKVLVTFGYGSNLPTTSKRRLQQSVQLARRVLQLERTNTSLKRQLEAEVDKVKEISEELSKSGDLLRLSQQPYQYLLEGMQGRDGQIQAQKKAIQELEKKLSLSQEKVRTVVQQNNELSADLERLLAHREELAVMRQVVVGLMSGKHPPLDSSQQHRRAPSTGPEPTTPREDVIQHPQPTVFTRQPAPQWYRSYRPT